MSRVVIVGAGPAGAALAFLLARRGIEVSLLERQTDFEREFRGEVLMPSGLDALQQMGLAQELAALPQTEPSALEVWRGDQRLVHFTFPTAPGGASRPRIISQPALLEMLVAQAGRFPRFQLERGVTVRDLLRDSERVAGVRVDDKDGSREVRGDLVIGADGRSSVLRRRAGLHEERFPQAFDVVWCKLPMPTFFANQVLLRGYVGSNHLALVFPSYDGRLQLAWAIQKGAFGDLKRQGIGAWVEEMAAHVSRDVAQHLRTHRDDVTSPFLLDVIADRLVQWHAPGLLLLGDAAHPMSPVAGQGINIALRDALVAANHLVPPLLSSAGGEALDAAARAFQGERMDEVATIQRLQHQGARFVFGEFPVLRAVGLFFLAPLLGRTGLPSLLVPRIGGRFFYGVSEVRLRV